MTRILVTGATGFVGRHVLPRLLAAGHAVRAALRRPDAVLPSGVEAAVVGDLAADTRWEAALEGVDGIVHLAGRAHVLRETIGNSEAVFRRINAEATAALAEAAARTGVRRLVVVSTAKVYGETSGSRPWRESDPLAPQDAYARSKVAAEQALAAVSARSGLETCSLRPPLVYGPGVGANFLALLRAVDRGLPLPLGRVDNRRSLVAVDNLASALVFALTAPTVVGRAFNVTDGRDVSTPELIRALARSLDRPPRLLPVPLAWLRLAGRITGRSAAVERLTGSLTLDSGALRAAGWRPEVTMDQALAAVARWYREARP